MAFWITGVAGLVVGYLFGSVPTAYLVGKLFYGLDIREHGSGSVGATNALRVLGRWPALAVLLADVLKGVAAVVFARWLGSRLLGDSFLPPRLSVDPKIWTSWVIALAGLAALLGHSRSVWLKFTGGKSVATGLGVVLVMAWPVAAGALAAFGAVMMMTRIVSLGSIAAALAAMALICGLAEPLPYRLLVVAGGVYVIARHRANIHRLAAGTEPRIRLSPSR
jgi:acyl phosphate:glycerol-3-phosphate acyltransferase